MITLWKRGSCWVLRGVGTLFIFIMRLTYFKGGCKKYYLLAALSRYRACVTVDNNKPRKSFLYTVLQACIW